MATLSAAGIGSGLDVNSLLEQIVAAERGPKESQLAIKEARAQAEITAYGSFKGSVSAYQSSLGRLKTATSFSSNTVSIANKDLLTATASSIANEGSYSIEVQKLAQSHSLASIAFTDMDTVIGNGTLTFDFGTTSYDSGSDDFTSAFVTNPERSSKSIVIDNSNNTVQGVRDAINDAGIGVTASIVDDGTGYKLLITSDQQGLDNSLEISVDEGGVPGNNTDTLGLSQLVFQQGATNLDQTQVGQDAVLKVNGLSISRESNTVTGAIHGVTLNLLSEDLGNPTQLSITKQTADAEKNIGLMVTAYNELITSYNQLTAYNSETGESGVLQGDSTVRTIMNQIRRELGNTVNTSGSYNSLSNIGITTQRDGTLSLDDSKLSAAIAADFDSVAELFYANGVSSDPYVKYVSSSASTTEGRHAVSISSLATQGVLSGVTSAELTAESVVIDGSNDSFSVTIDGVSSGTLNLAHATYADMAALALEIQNRINESSALQGAGLGVTVSYSTTGSNHFEISSTSYGSDSSVSITSQSSILGLTTSATETAGTDVVGSIGSSPATGSGQFLTGTGAASGLSLEITGTTAGNRGSVVFSRGMASKLDSMLTQFLSSSGQLESKTNSLNQRIETIAEDRVTLYKRVAAIEERYRTQFTALDVLMGQLNTTSNYLQQQLDALPEIQIN